MIRARILTVSLIIVTLSIKGCQSEADQTYQDIPYETPEWTKGVIWYQIFPERFRDGDPANNPTAEHIGAPDNWEVSPWTGDWYQRAEWEQRVGPTFRDFVFERRYGGDLQGVIDKLDYLDELGVGAIYFNPIFDARTLHKYDAAHYHHIDRFFGPDPEGDAEIMAREDPSDPETWEWTSADRLFLELLEEAKEREIRIVIDGVWNHTGPEFWAFQDIAEHGEDSEFVDWYKVIEFDDEYEYGFDYEGWWGYKGLPEFREDGDDLYAPVKQHIFDVTERWMAPDGDVSRGIDGWRLDVTEELGKEFWRDWHAHVREINPEAYTVAEIWTDAAEEFVNADLFNAVMNYRFAYAVKEFMIDGWLNAGEFRDRLDDLRYSYAYEANHAMQNLMDSHDTPRVASMVLNPGLHYDHDAQPEDGYILRKPNGEEREIQRLIHLFQYTWIGSPMVYYGTESGMWGADDPHDRKPMVWYDLEYDEEINHPFGKERPRDDQNFDHDLHQYFIQLGEIRNNSLALQKGDYEPVIAENRKQTFGFVRFTDDEWVIVVLNRSEENQTVQIEIPDYLDEKTGVRDYLTGEEYQIDNGNLDLVLKPVSGVVLE